MPASDVRGCASRFLSGLGWLRITASSWGRCADDTAGACISRCPTAAMNGCRAHKHIPVYLAVIPTQLSLRASPQPVGCSPAERCPRSSRHRAPSRHARARRRHRHCRLSCRQAPAHDWHPAEPHFDGSCLRRSRLWLGPAEAGLLAVEETGPRCCVLGEGITCMRLAAGRVGCMSHGRLGPRPLTVGDLCCRKYRPTTKTDGDSSDYDALTLLGWIAAHQ